MRRRVGSRIGNHVTKCISVRIVAMQSSRGLGSHGYGKLRTMRFSRGVGALFDRQFYPAWGARQISKLLGLQWEVRGMENAVNDTGCVILINHQSALDLLVLAELWPRLERCFVISKKEVFYLWPFGLAAWLWGTAKLCMFPEGTRHNGTTLLPFKKGAFHVAISSQTPIQPVVVSRYYFLDNAKKIFNPGKSIITILPAIPTAGLGKEDLNDLMERTRDAMLDVYARVSEEVVASSKTDKQLN
uniref:1-acylglycerol-3-phosphate O-acyltransferase n=1 Tax=Timema douglasi TaxID=61478 RepID=A0A7R8VUV3_TIMDO|nr:unnamed protein product [Timema douglasi]